MHDPEYGYNDPDYGDVIELKFRPVKATRKLHTCYICKQPISVGSRAAYTVVLEDGKFFADYQHWLHCPLGR